MYYFNATSILQRYFTIFLNVKEIAFVIITKEKLLRRRRKEKLIDFFNNIKKGKENRI